LRPGPRASVLFRLVIPLEQLAPDPSAMYGSKAAALKLYGRHCRVHGYCRLDGDL